MVSGADQENKWKEKEESLLHQTVQLARDLPSPAEAGRLIGVSEIEIRVWMKKSIQVMIMKSQDPGFSIEEYHRLQIENEKLNCSI